MTIHNPDEELLVPIPHGMRRRVSPEMVISDHDFGPHVGVHNAISLRNLWLVMGISDEKMAEIDEARREKGLKSMFGDDAL